MTATRLYLPPLAIQRVRAASAAAWPHEACGLLEGEASDTGVRVAQVLECANVHEEPGHRYTIDPEEFLRAERAAESRGCNIVGVWHSHPNGEPSPSNTDLADAWAGWSYLIAGVTNGALTGLRCWHLADGRFVEQPVVTAGEPATDRETPNEYT